MGRPRRPIDYREVLARVKRGETLRGMARSMGVPWATLFYRTRVDPELMAAWEPRRTADLVRTAMSAVATLRERGFFDV